jgi:hypothetical protein
MLTLKMGEFETINKQELEGTEVFEEFMDFFKDQKPSLPNYTNNDCLLHVKDPLENFKTLSARHLSQKKTKS